MITVTTGQVNLSRERYGKIIIRNCVEQNIVLHGAPGASDHTISKPENEF